MSVQDLLVEIKLLSVQEQLELLEALTGTLREELHSRTAPNSSVNRVRGMLRPDGATPNDADVADLYASYLLEKYS